MQVVPSLWLEDYEALWQLSCFNVVLSGLAGELPVDRPHRRTVISGGAFYYHRILGRNGRWRERCSVGKRQHGLRHLDLRGCNIEDRAEVPETHNF